MKQMLFIALSILSFGLIKAQDTVFSFNTLPLPDTGFCNGQNLNGYFSDTVNNTVIKLYNDYNPDWDSWQGFAYSIWTNDSTADYSNQWSAYPGFLIDSTFVIGYIGIDWNNNYQNIPIGLKFSKKIQIKSIYVANTTYTALTIKDGNQFSAPFSDGDYYKLIITGFHNGETTGQIEHYLADYRDAMHFIQKDWAFVDLSPLGIIDSLSFNVISSDVGDFGMNTPGYFIFDQLRFSPAENTSAIQNITPERQVKIYPNPANRFFIVPANTQKTIIYSLQGNKLMETKLTNIHVANLPNGIYVIRVWDGKSWHSTKVIIKH